ncbi:MAG: gamma carbonic anhydrase family protein [Minwuia sp.]|uniref:gamma carbonic anhydrase family protein n=1 Tax=Minwuia sp. TaxID=2493630 RepID=UPI003A8AD935
MPFHGPDIVIKNPAFIHDTVQVYGKVTIEDGVSVWPNVVMRAESQQIVIGKRSNIQDFTMIHVGAGSDSIIGEDCSVTHHCTIHGCTIGDACLIGINAVVADGAVIGDNCIVGQNAFVRENQKIPANSIVVGVPAAIKATRDNELPNRMNAFMYYENALAYAAGNYRRWSEEGFMKLAADEMDRLKAMIAGRTENA